MQAIDRLHGRRGIEKGRLGQRSFSDVDEHPESVGDVFVEGPLQAERDAVDGGFTIQAIHMPLDVEQRRSSRYETADGRHDAHEAIGCHCHRDERIAVDRCDHAGRGGENGRRWNVVEGQRVRVLRIEQTSRVVADQFDERRHPEGPPDVVDVQDQHRNAHDHQDIGHADGDARNLALTVGLDLTHRQHRVGERRHEQADRQLTRSIA